jgi:uncharacterized membrane protein YkoI
MTTRLTLALAVLAFAGLGAAPGLAGSSDKQHASEHEIAREALRRGEILPLTRILPIVQQRVPGDVIKVKLDDDDKRIEYEVKVLTGAGRVIEVHLDARTGRILKTEED